MKEHDFIKIIKEQTKSSYLGDDCAYLKELGIVVTQDNFIENIHFKTDWATPYQIGFKATAVNISDILASGAKPAYLSIGLSLPKNIEEDFIIDFYKGVKEASCGAKVIGGDITSAENISISITAIGTSENRKISSRSNAKEGYVVIAKDDNFGLSSIGLKELKEGKKNTSAIRAHLEPVLDVEFSEDISTRIKVDYAMMDTSDGLADALFQIAKASNVKIVSKYINGMFGAEDYKLIAAIPEDFSKQLTNFTILGKVEKFDGTYLKIDNINYSNYNELNLYDHFGENNE